MILPQTRSFLAAKPLVLGFVPGVGWVWGLPASRFFGLCARLGYLHFSPPWR